MSYPCYILGCICEMFGNVCICKTSQVCYSTEKTISKYVSGRLNKNFPVCAKPPYPSVYAKRPSDPR